jgi:hypothetical protein
MWYIWDSTKAVLREMFRVINAYSKNSEWSEISNSAIHIKLLENQEQTKLQRIYGNK